MPHHGDGPHYVMEQLHEMAVQLRPIQRLYTLLKQHYPFAEFLVGLTGIFYGIWLSNPWWHSFKGAVSYTAMARLAPEWAWGAFFIVIGCAVLVGLITDRRQIRLYATWLMSAGWLFVAIMIAVSNIQSTGVPVYGCLATATIWSFWRIWVSDDD